MKYYAKQPYFLYLIIGAGIGTLVGVAVIGVLELSGVLLDESGRSVVVIGVIILTAIVYVRYHTRYRDYMELLPDSIVFASDSRRNKPAVVVAVQDIRMIERVTEQNDGSKVSYNMLYAASLEGPLLFTEVPDGDIDRFCSEQHIPVRCVAIDTDGVKVVRLRKKDIAIIYHGGWIEKKVSIAYCDVVLLAIVAANEITVTDRHYDIYSKDGTKCRIAASFIDEPALRIAAGKYGIEVQENIG